MQIVIPMSGEGTRFKKAGYREVKPLIEVDGAPMIEHVINMFPGETDFVFICTKDALATTQMRAVLTRLMPSGRIVEIEPHKLGPVHAVLQAAPHIRAGEPVVVNYCDFSAEWSYRHFKQTVAELCCDGCITAYRGFHPHTLGPNLYAYMRHDNGYLLEIAEKHCFTDNRMEEYASAGTYYFRSGTLLLKYFQMAVDAELRTNGEFYASMPYNLLVQDGLKVYIYELKRFMQWGTPEDLDEYLGWSRYFRKYESWRPSLPLHAGANLIPMAGAGIRFAKEGYADPKPLVRVNGKTLVERSLDCLPAAAKWVAVSQSAHLQDLRLRKALNGNSRTVETVEVTYLPEGQAASCLLARDCIDPEAPLLIAPCDSATVYDEKLLADLIADQATDCLVWAFKNHPHANRNPKQYGWVITSEGGIAREILCKQPPPTPAAETPGIIGTFWFRKARYFLEAADRLIAENRRVNGEFYADSCIQVLIEMGRTVRTFPVDCYICLGTPDDVRTYEYWAGHFHARENKAGVNG